MSTETIAVGSAIISALALLVSFANYWSANLKVGQILMTKPTIFCFTWDGNRPKIYLRTLLFATSNNGRVLENLYLLVKSPTQETIYSFWGHAHGGKETLTKGSGLFIPKNGYLADHHFNPDPSGNINIPYPVGLYEIEVIARQFEDTTDRKLGRYEIRLDPNFAAELANNETAVIWSLNPLSQSYHAELR